MNDNYWTPPPTADLTRSFSLTDPFLPKPHNKEFDVDSPQLSATSFQPTDKQSRTDIADLRYDSDPRRLKLLVRGFEKPNSTRITFLVALCFTAYPLLYLLKLVAMDKTLFTVRLMVAMWCSGIGFSFGYILIRIGIRHLEAATWATVIHMSHEGSGMKLRDLDRTTQHPTSLFPAVWIFVSRLWNQNIRRSRKSFDKRPWFLFLGFVIVLAIFGPLLPFLLGRIMDIEIFVRIQRVVYHEVLITGDLSQSDVDGAGDQLWAFNDFVRTWTLLPYGSSPPDTATFIYENDTVYFAEPSFSQFMPGGSGAGTFNISRPASKDRPNNTFASGDTHNSGSGVILRYPQWGIRIHCQKLTNPEVNLIPSSNKSVTRVFIPQDLLRDLFGTFGMALPHELGTGLDTNETIPPNINRLQISYLAEFSDNGVAHSFFSQTIDNTGSIHDQGWTTVETVLVRLNTSLTPHGRFPVLSNNTSPDGVGTTIGYDAAVCVQKYEPWIIETYNTSVGSPTVLGIVEKANYGSVSLLPDRGLQGPPIVNTRYLNTTGKNHAFYVAHDNSVNQMLKDNGRDHAYVPSPTVVSFTDGVGATGYTELSPDRFSAIRGQVDAANVLPYLVGSGSVVARSYPDQMLAYVTYNQWLLIGLLVFILILGITGELFVPMLPLNIPRRGFGLYSWLALLRFQELRLEADELDRLISLDELEKKLSDKRIKFHQD